MPPMGIWTIASIVCLIVAGLFLYRRNFDAAFVLAALGAVAWFLNYRAQIRKTIPAETETTREEADASEDVDEEQ
jgi:uncharacterized membrane protein YhfC